MERIEDETNRDTYPFYDKKIPVMKGPDEFQAFIEQYRHFIFCPYIADKTLDEWKVSTSRQYMNQAVEKFLYVPVNIDAGNSAELARIVQLADDDQRIAAVNITKPHKSAPVLREYFFGDACSTGNIDTLIKTSEHKLQPFDLNAPAFVDWFEDEVTRFQNKNVVILGIGGVGEPIAKNIDKHDPASLTLVDTKDCHYLLSQLHTHSIYQPTLTAIPREESIILVNASGKDGISDDTGIVAFLESTKKGIFVDLRPQLEIPIVQKAKQLGWQAYTGNGMNARNDFILLTGIMDYAKILPQDRMTFQEFSVLVTRAS